MHRLKDGAIIEDGWTEKSWFDFQAKLAKLSLKQLFSIGTVTGLIFECPFNKLKKDWFLGALAEVDRKELEMVYKLLMKNRLSKRTD